MKYFFILLIIVLFSNCASKPDFTTFEQAIYPGYTTRLPGISPPHQPFPASHHAHTRRTGYIIASCRPYFQYLFNIETLCYGMFFVVHTPP